MKIYLIGFMGAGKSTVGHLLGKALNATFIDLDQLIEQKCNKKISEIFKDDGEMTFRKIEADYLKTSNGEIIATGGGVLYFEETGQWMQQEGVVIYLQAPFEELYARIQGDRTRPVAAKPYEELKDLYHKRDHAYRNISHIQVSVSRRSPEDTVTDILSSLKVNGGK